MARRGAFSQGKAGPMNPDAGTQRWALTDHGSAVQANDSERTRSAGTQVSEGADWLRGPKGDTGSTGSPWKGAGEGRRSGCRGPGQATGPTIEWLSS
jgi:hypothetical protein